MVEGHLTPMLEDEDDMPVVARIGAAVAHKDVVARWAQFYIEQGFEVRVEMVADGVMEGVAW